MKDWTNIAGIIGAVIIALAVLINDGDKQLVYYCLALIGLLGGVTLIRKRNNIQ